MWPSQGPTRGLAARADCLGIITIISQYWYPFAQSFHYLAVQSARIPSVFAQLFSLIIHYYLCPRLGQRKGAVFLTGQGRSRVDGFRWSSLISSRRHSLPRRKAPALRTQTSVSRPHIQATGMNFRGRHRDKCRPLLVWTLRHLPYLGSMATGRSPATERIVLTIAAITPAA